MMKRRDFIVGTTVFLASPKIARAKEPFQDFLDGVFSTLDQEPFVEENRIFNQMLVVRHPHLFNLDYAMKGPVDIIRGETVSARSRAFNTTFPSLSSLPSSPPTISPIDRRGVVVATKELVDSIAKEIEDEQDRLEMWSGVMCPYVPVMAIRLVHPRSFTPYIGFKTRYGVYAA